MKAKWKTQYPALIDLERKAKGRMPHFSWEFLDSGTGRDEAAKRNKDAFRDVSLTPRFMRGEFTPSIETNLFGINYAAPFGIAPVGMNSLSWPGTDEILARTAGRVRIPYSMSTAANATPETLGQLANGMGWFQLYPPRNNNMRITSLAPKTRDLQRCSSPSTFWPLVDANDRCEQVSAADLVDAATIW